MLDMESKDRPGAEQVLLSMWEAQNGDLFTYRRRSLFKMNKLFCG
jgi:hypothetical protein